MNYHLELKGVRKQFGPTEIIRGVNLNIKKRRNSLIDRSKWSW